MRITQYAKIFQVPVQRDNSFITVEEIDFGRLTWQYDLADYPVYVSTTLETSNCTTPAR